MKPAYDVIILGLSVTSSWGNGHATTYRSLIRGLAQRGHRVLFLERNAPWYAGNRDEPNPVGARTEIYESFDELTARWEDAVTAAGLVIVGSFVPEGARVGDWVLSVAQGVCTYYDIDTPVTFTRLAEGCREFLTPELIRRYQIYLSFTGGPVLRRIESEYGSPMARALYCSVDPDQYRPSPRAARWDLGYLGTYSADRQPALEQLLLEPARRFPEGNFIVAGPMYPEDIQWPANVSREIHLSPREHAGFYGSQRFTLNITRAAMKEAGYSPSVRLFEASACGAPIISDWWDGLDTLFAENFEILIAHGVDDTLRYLRDYPDAQRRALGAAARDRILSEHTPEQRAIQLEHYVKEVHDNFSAHPPRGNGRGRQVNDGVDARLAPELAREGSRPEACGAAGAASHSGCLHEPTGAGAGNRRSDRPEA